MSDLETDTVHTGDCLDVLDEMHKNSVHAVVTDPPYGLAFMGRDWDDFDPREYQDWCMEWAEAVRRVLKPGGHLLAFSGNRTHHRLFSGVEDAGYEIRDTITWHYGSGFPKALDVSKNIPWPQLDPRVYKWFEGGKTALKPATEFVVVARAPLSEGTVAENVQTHGTGALNVDGCRIDNVSDSEAWDGDSGFSECDGKALEGSRSGELNTQNSGLSTEGRYPANVVFDEQAATQLDREVGETSSGGGNSRAGDETASTRYDSEGGTDFAPTPGQRRGDSGGPSRYFYTSKATKAERTLDGRIENAHPTVKPQDLMEWLVTLVTAEGQTVLDPFAGTGTTGRACKDKGREFVLIERQAKWADVARVRCGLSPEDPSHVRSDDAQTGLEVFAE